VKTYSFQAGTMNPHYGRISHWLSSWLCERLPDVAVDIKVGRVYEDLRAVGDGLAQIGVTTPAAAARLCMDGEAEYERPRPALRSIGVVPHRDALVVGAIRELGLASVDDIRERRAPLRLSVPVESMMTGHASRHVLARHDITRESLEAWGGQWIDTDSAQAAWRMVADGTADAMINESIPQSFKVLARRRPIRLLSMREDAVERLHEELGYVWRRVPAGTVTGQEEPVIGLSWDHWIVVAHADLPNEVGYALADAFCSHAWALERQYTADNRIGPDDCSLEAPMRLEVVAGEVTVPLHPGAEKRYREAGIV
jgi:TRAP-type uncharacterized transport system substrate-binding protein